MDRLKPDISVIIVSYNVQEYLQHCINSILNQKDIIAEIIVVDNNSTDGTKELITSKYPFVKFIGNSDNVGFSAANNQGIKEASGEIILLLNPDTELMEIDTLQHAKKYLETNAETGILAPCLLNENGSFQLSFWHYPGIKKLMLELFYMHRIKNPKQPSLPIPVEAASGAAFFFRKSLVNKIGGLDENMFWMEDVDFCYRTYKSGNKVIWNPDMKIIHHGGKSSVANRSITVPNQVMSRIKFSKKNYSKPEFYIVNMVSFIFICSRLLIFTLVSFINKKYNAPKKAYMVTLKAYFRFNFKGNNAIIK